MFFVKSFCITLSKIDLRTTIFITVAKYQQTMNNVAHDISTQVLFHVNINLFHVIIEVRRCLQTMNTRTVSCYRNKEFHSFGILFSYLVFI